MVLLCLFRSVGDKQAMLHALVSLPGMLHLGLPPKKARQANLAGASTHSARKKPGDAAAAPTPDGSNGNMSNRMEMTAKEAKLSSAEMARSGAGATEIPPPPCSCIQEGPAVCCPMYALRLWLLCMVVCMFASCAWGVGISLKI